LDYIQSDLAVIVVFFNPSRKQVAFATTLSKLFENVIIVDNSPIPINDIHLRLKASRYYWMRRNLGIATALNYGCTVAMSLGSKYALLLDQDTVFISSTLCQHVEVALSLFINDKVALVAPGPQILEPINEHLPFPVKSAITSGSIIRLTSWRATGRFNDGLFIDQVDHDFCIRLRLCGNTILANPAVSMTHKIGDPLEKNILGCRIVSTNHHWLRRYYQVRNSLYLRSWYPSESKSRADFIKDIFLMALGIILVEHGRARKLYAMFIGTVDFFRNRLGSWGDCRNLQM